MKGPRCSALDMNEKPGIVGRSVGQPPSGAALPRHFTLEFFLQHPATSPDTRLKMGPYLICGPSTFCSTARWLAFRDRTLLPMIEERPGDAFLADYLLQVEKILAWRAAIPAEQRFWRAD
jgi:hypothetical protein